jgi:hypothetical protein
MSNLPAWKNVVSGGLDPNGTPYYAPNNAIDIVEIITSIGNGSASVAYADDAGTAISASYATNNIF